MKVNNLINEESYTHLTPQKLAEEVASLLWHEIFTADEIDNFFEEVRRQLTMLQNKVPSK